MSGIWDRTRSQILIIHHLGDGKPPAKSKEELWKRANPSGYQFPNYDYGVLESGEILPLRPLTYVGGHTLSNIQPYSDRGKNWFNENAISIVIANDNSKYPPPEIMLKKAGEFVRSFRKKYPKGEIFPHYAVTKTYCPGKEFFQKIIEYSKKEVLIMPIVFYHGPDDVIFARRVAEKIGGVMAPRTDAEKYPDAEKYFVGGVDYPGAKENICGSDFLETTGKFLEFMLRRK